MIYPNVGISMFMHMAVVTVGKIKGSGKSGTKDYAQAKTSVFKKIFSALCIAMIIELVLFFVVGSSMIALYVGITSNKSNLSMIEDLYKYETKNNTSSCSSKTSCYLSIK